MDGYLNVLKLPGMTSHDVVQYVRKLFPKVKIGHGGTLDPGAAGVLPLLLGKATKFSSYLVDLPKIYRAELFLGVTTDTEDSSGKVITKRTPFPLSAEDLHRVLASYQGEIEQIPPMYAAVKQGGKKLYEYARQGIIVERPARKVQIYALKLLDYKPPERVLFEVECSKGTYIRTLCVQIGTALGYGGHMSFLLRKAVGGFSLSEACLLEGINFDDDVNKVQEAILPLDYPFRGKEHLLLEKEEINKLAQGQFLTRHDLHHKAERALGKPVDEKLLPVYTTTREFVGLAKWKFDRITGFRLKSAKIIPV